MTRALSISPYFFIVKSEIISRISSTFSVLRPFSYIRPLYFELFTSTRLLRSLYFDLLSNLDFLLVEKHRSKYSFGRSKDMFYAIIFYFCITCKCKLHVNVHHRCSNVEDFEWKIIIIQTLTPFSHEPKLLHDYTV